MIYSVDVRVTTPVNDTEVEERVVEAVRNVFPTAEIDRQDGRIVATGHEVEALRERLFEQRILDTARAVFFDSRRGDTLAFDLKKQAAAVGQVTFAVGDPAELGDLHVEVTVEEPDVEAFLDYLAPETDDEGRPPEGP